MTGRWFTEDDIKGFVSLTEVIDALETVLGREVESQAINIPKAMATWDRASSGHALGGVDRIDRLLAFKTWVNTPLGAKAVLTLFDSDNADVLAVMEAAYLGSLRTAAISGLATKWMADPSADELAVIGSGRQALSQIKAVAAVRELRNIRVWSPTQKHREEFAQQVQEATNIVTTARSTLEDTVGGVPIVTLITRASEPFLRREHLAPGAHLNAVGSVLPAKAEFEPSLLADADLVAVDNLENARRSSRELREFYGDDLTGVTTLGTLVAEKYHRPAGTVLTVFKGLGMGLSDLAAASVVARNAGLQGNR